MGCSAGRNTARVPPTRPLPCPRGPHPTRRLLDLRRIDAGARQVVRCLYGPGLGAASASSPSSSPLRSVPSLVLHSALPPVIAPGRCSHALARHTPAHRPVEGELIVIDYEAGRVGPEPAAWAESALEQPGRAAASRATPTPVPHRSPGARACDSCGLWAPLFADREDLGCLRRPERVQRHAAKPTVLEAAGVAQPPPPAVRPVIRDAQHRARPAVRHTAAHCVVDQLQDQLLGLRGDPRGHSTVRPSRLFPAEAPARSPGT